MPSLFCRKPDSFDLVVNPYTYSGMQWDAFYDTIVILINGGSPDGISALKQYINGGTRVIM
jgi:hypothetical protein